MGAMFDEKADLAIVDAVFQLHGLTSVGFRKDELRAAKTPDRRLLREDQTVAYVEVKSPQYDDWLESQLEFSPPMKIVGGAKKDPTFSRIARHIDTAAKQFYSVNPSRNVPNILFFINHNHQSHWGDLYEVLTRHFLDNNGNKHATMLNISEGKIRNSKNQIDCFIWYEKKSEVITGYIFSNENTEHCQEVCKLLSLDFSKIK